MAITKPRVVSAGCPREMLHVVGKSFLMGSRAGIGDEDEHPQHSVKLSGYCIDRTEVPVAAYAACVAAGACLPIPELMPREIAGLCNASRDDRQQHPVNCVNWAQAVAYCAFVGKRLPTEAEWEYAATGPGEQRFPWGNDAPSAGRLNACGSECRPLRARLGVETAVMYEASDRWETTAPVGSFPRAVSPVGALDMDGNVSEWTSDLYASYAGTASTFQDGPHRVVRGGAFLDTDASRVRGASRGNAAPGSYDVNIGFRCARSE
jgi:formylglycine-generating enzyme required for sulfatase activity